jgi:hypothetical protein
VNKLSASALQSYGFIELQKQVCASNDGYSYMVASVFEAGKKLTDTVPSDKNTNKR